MRTAETRVQANFDDAIEVQQTSTTVSAGKVWWNNTVLATLLSLVVGTGGVANAAAIAKVPNPPNMVVTICEPQSTTTEASDFLLPGEKLASIQRYFSMNVSDLASVLRVARPTVYSWIKQRSEPRDANLDRIERLYRLGRSWRKMSDKPVGAFLKMKKQGGTSLLDDSSAPQLNEAAILTTLKDVSRTIQAPSKRLSVAESASKRGLKPVSRNIKKWSFDESFNS